ncbi:hypothetical protein BDF19DRAFT_413855 [Syncephalis fuscata]|nr:hypothetical protein BDF19DRAFT_413855 [Syncephalis fuscata]
MFAKVSRRTITAIARIATLALVVSFVVVILESSNTSVDAVYQNNLIAIFNNYTIGGDAAAPAGGGDGSGGDGSSSDGSSGSSNSTSESSDGSPEDGAASSGEGGEEMPPPMPNCLYAYGLGDHYPVVNDACQTMRWRPGQAWKFDPEILQAYQPIRVGENFCLSIEAATYAAKAIVVECPNDSAAVPSEAQWRLSTDGSNHWFTNLRTSLCLRGSDKDDAFTVETCTNDPAFLFKVRTF